MTAAPGQGLRATVAARPVLVARPAVVALSAFCAFVLGACSAGSGGPSGAPAASSPPATHAASKASATTSPSASPTPTVAHLSPPAVPGVTWRAAGTVVNGVTATYIASTAGGSVGLLWIDPSVVSFRLIPGFRVPEGGPATAADNTPSTWVPRMVAAFNGGFLLKDGVGGYYADHRMVRPLVSNLAAFEITADGRLAVGAWGRDLQLTSKTVVVRQNLRLLVDHGRSQTSTSDGPRTWGIANGGLWTANRSALGQLADGSLVFAYGHETRAATMAAALVQVGAQRAIALDMNKSWPGGFVYRHTAGAIVGQRVHPLQYHSPSVYYTRYTKDFVAVLRR